MISWPSGCTHIYVVYNKHTEEPMTYARKTLISLSDTPY